LTFTLYSTFIFHRRKRENYAAGRRESKLTDDEKGPSADERELKSSCSALQRKRVLGSVTLMRAGTQVAAAAASSECTECMNAFIHIIALHLTRQQLAGEAAWTLMGEKERRGTLL
jgi:hypothetical protein